MTNGAGHLRSRIIAVAAGGRRLPSPRTVSLLVDATSGQAACSLAPAPVADLVIDLAVDPTDERDPQAELLAEMTDNLDATDAIVDGDHRLAG